MTTIHTVSKVRPDGSVVVPVGVQDAGTEVEVTITPRPARKRASEMTQAEHAAFIESFNGRWIGDFPEIPDPPPDPVDPL